MAIELPHGVLAGVDKHTGTASIAGTDAATAYLGTIANMVGVSHLDAVYRVTASYSNTSNATGAIGVSLIPIFAIDTGFAVYATGTDYAGSAGGTAAAFTVSATSDGTLTTALYAIGTMSKQAGPAGIYAQPQFQVVAPNASCSVTCTVDGVMWWR